MVFALVGAYMPFLPVFLRQIGLDDRQIGWVIASYGLCMVFMPIVAGHWADRHWSNRSMLAACTLGVAVSLGGLCLVDGGFWLVLGLFTMFSISFTPLFSLLAGLAFAAIHEQEDAGLPAPSYHEIRMWGSIGFTLPGFGLLAVFHFTDFGVRFAIATAAGCALLTAATAWLLPEPKRHKPAENEPDLPSRASWNTVIRPPVRTAVGSMILIFTALSVLYAFYPRYLQELGVHEKWMGLIANIGVVEEVIFIWFAHAFVRRFGLRGVMLIAVGATALRMVMLAAAPSIAVALLSQLLHGPVVVLVYVLVPMYLNFKAGKANRNSMQGLFSMLCFGLARLAGSVIGGQFSGLGAGDELRGLQWTFASAAVLSMIALIWLAMRFFDPEAETYMRKKPAKEIGHQEPLPEEGT